MLTRTIPRTGEAIPAVGLGTWAVFDVALDGEERSRLSKVLDRFYAAGARLIDTSPMYGRAEGVIGDLGRGRKVQPFLAAKVWITGKDEGEAQMRSSMRLMGTDRMDLIQIHNLVDWKTHLATLRAWKKEGH